MFINRLVLLSMARYRRNLIYFRRLWALLLVVSLIVAEHAGLLYDLVKAIIKLLR